MNTKPNQYPYTNEHLEGFDPDSQQNHLPGLTSYPTAFQPSAAGRNLRKLPDTNRSDTRFLEKALRVVEANLEDSTFTSNDVVKGMSSWTASDLIDSRLTVYAQRSLLRLLKGSPVEQKVAADLITSVKAGDMEGIYVVNQVKPVQRAREIGTYWWQLIPKGVSIISV